jgi:hypothetical protein
MIHLDKLYTKIDTAYPQHYYHMLIQSHAPQLCFDN